MLTASKVINGSLIGAIWTRSKASYTVVATGPGLPLRGTAGSAMTTLLIGMSWVLQLIRAVRWSSVSATTVAWSRDGVPLGSSQPLSMVPGPPGGTGRSWMVSSP